MSNSRPWVWLVVAAVAFGAVWLGPVTPAEPSVDPFPVMVAVAPSASFPATPAVRPGPPLPPGPEVRVRYEILGPSPAGVVTYTTDATGPVSEAMGVRLPWSREFDADGGFVPSVSAQGTGPISCRITVDGVELSSVTTSGRFAVATCTGHALD